MGGAASITSLTSHVIEPAPPVYQDNMSTKHLVLLFAFCFHLALGGKEAIFGIQSESEAVPMKKYTIDLDQSPQERWIPLLKDFKSSAPLIIDYYRKQVTIL